MKILIELSEDDFKKAVEDDNNHLLDRVWDAVAHGIPLPKGHGRLIDADRLKSMYSINQGNFNTVVGIQKWIDFAPTIIEAEEVEKNER